jgi:hypothetical protein
VLSSDTVKSDVALKEIAYAGSLNKRFAPIVFRRVDDARVPETLRRLNFVFLDEQAGFDAVADQLAEALHTNIEWIGRQTYWANRPGVGRRMDGRAGRYCAHQSWSMPGTGL